MSIFLDNNSTVIVQGITGRDGSFHTKQMIEYFSESRQRIPRLRRVRAPLPP